MQPSRLLLAVSVAGLLWLSPARMPGQNAPEKKYKDDAEFQLYDSILKDTNPKTKLDKLKQWESKYPSTDFSKERKQLFFTTYLAASMPKETLDAAQVVLADDPKDFNALYYTMLLTRLVYNGSQPAVLDQGEKATNALLGSLDTPPAGIEADKWAKLKPDIERDSHMTLGFIGVQRKNWDAAEAELRKSLQIDANNGYVDYLMYYTLANKKDYSKSFYYYARAAAYDGPGSLPPQQRQTYMTDVQKLYTTYHGKADGFNDLVTTAKSAPSPPDGFHIKSKGELAKEAYDAASANEEKFKAEHPEWFLWKSIKETLNGPTGADYFNSMKDTKVPTLKCTVVKIEPALKPKTLLVTMQDGTVSDTPVADATLKFEAALPGKVEPGTELSFEGVPKSYTAGPLMVVFEVDKDDLHGWTGKNAPAAPVHRPPAKKR
jgi:tetratricopeptide (TPR) repeat protein